MIDVNKQNQTAGDGSCQFQNSQVTIVSGIDEKRVREIVTEIFEKDKREFTQEALEKVQERINRYEEILISKLMESVDRLNALKDPAFQFVLSEANKKAACMDREVDYQLLSELIINRAMDVKDRERNAGLNVAISIVDQIDDITLRGLTLAFAILSFVPAAYSISDGLKAIDVMYEALIDGELPIGSKWLDNLDLLKCIRLSYFGQRGMLKLLKEKYDGYFCPGIVEDSPEYHEAKDLIEKYNLPSEILVTHELFDGRYRVLIQSHSQIDNMEVTVDQLNKDGRTYFLNISLTDEQKKAVRKIFDLCNKDKTSVDDAIIKEVSKYPHIRKAMDWWDSISFDFSLTSAGKVLAHANANRLFPNLPEFKE